MATREQLTRDAKSRGLTGREASAWVSYQLAKERLSSAQDERRAKAAAKKAAPPKGNRPAPARKKPTAPKSAGFGFFSKRGR